MDEEEKEIREVAENEKQKENQDERGGKNKPRQSTPRSFSLLAAMWCL